MRELWNRLGAPKAERPLDGMERLAIQPNDSRQNCLTIYASQLDRTERKSSRPAGASGRSSIGLYRISLL